MENDEDLKSHHGDPRFDPLLPTPKSVPPRKKQISLLPSDNSCLACPTFRAMAYLKLEEVTSSRSVQSTARASQCRAIAATWEMSQLGLARAYVLQGDTAKARAAYQDFFTLWRDEDPTSPS
jgi:hypothetical protein